MLDLLIPSKEHRKLAEKSHKLDYSRSCVFIHASSITNTLFNYEIQVSEARDTLARCLQHNASTVLNPGVGRLRRAEAEFRGRAIGGAWVGPLFFARHTTQC
jgi:hypothetical protein